MSGYREERVATPRPDPLQGAPRAFRLRQGLLRIGAVRRFLRFPLYHKIVVANSAFVLVAAVAVAVTSVTAAGRTAPLGVALVAGAVLLAITVTAFANALLVRLALSPVLELEDTVRRVEQGDLEARVPPSPLADENLARLGRQCNEMLERLAEDRQRQRQLAVMVLEAEERERMWLARELYDDTAQVLAAVLLQVRAASRARDGGAALPLQRIREEIAGALDGIRKIARRLRPPELDDLGLTAAVTAHARTLAEVSGTHIECDVEPVDALLSPEARQTLYRILHEAMNNAVRHARASRVRVSLGPGHGAVVASVQDDGQGFDPASAPPSMGAFGLVGIRERANYLHGRAEVDSSPGSGTRIRIWIPSRRVAEPAEKPEALSVSE